MSKATTCTVEGCDREREARGLCPRHYKAAWSRGEHLNLPKDRDDVEREAAFLELQASGLTAPQIAERLNVTPRTVARWRVRHGLAEPIPVTAGVPASPERLRAAEALLNEGASYQEVGRTLGMTSRTLAHHFPGRGWSRQESGSFAAMVSQMNRRIRAEYHLERKTA